MSPAKRPTLRDVAREAGLSVTQVSRALNGHDDVAPGTRDRAVEAAGRIGYAPNLEARRLKMPDAKAHSIGLVMTGRGQRFSDPFFGDLLSSIVDEAEANGYELQLSTGPTEENPVAVYERSILHKRVDGFVVTRLLIDDERVRFLQGRNFPFVVFGRLPDVDGLPFVDERDDALQPAVDLLVDLGHRRIACIAEPSRYAKAHYRLRSFELALAARGIELAPNMIVEADFREDSGRTAALGLLRASDRPTAIVAFNDLLAIGALRAADEVGVDVPTELSVIGFDDIDAARLVTPRLTTLRQPTGEVGRLLVRRLLVEIGHLPLDDRAVGGGVVEGGVVGGGAVEGGAVGEPALVRPELVVRGSTGPPPG